MNIYFPSTILDDSVLLQMDLFLLHVTQVTGSNVEACGRFQYLFSSTLSVFLASEYFSSAPGVHNSPLLQSRFPTHLRNFCHSISLKIVRTQCLPKYYEFMEKAGSFLMNSFFRLMNTEQLSGNRRANEHEDINTGAIIGKSYRKGL